MPICSYVLHPTPGGHERVVNQLAQFPACNVYPADNAKILILVTDTPDPAAESALRDELARVPDIACLSLAYAHSEEETYAQPT